MNVYLFIFFEKIELVTLDQVDFPPINKGFPLLYDHPQKRNIYDHPPKRNNNLSLKYSFYFIIL